MTNNLDQFDQSPDFEDVSDESGRKKGMVANLADAWRTKPIFKLIVILAGLGALVMGVLSLTAAKPEADISRVQAPPPMVEAPGGKASPDFIAAQAQANEQRTKEAAAQGGTALPTPLPSGMSPEQRKEGDPLVEFRAEMKRQKEEQQRQIQALQQQNQQQQQVVLQQDQQVQEKIGTSLTQQMTQLAEMWKPKSMNVFDGVDDRSHTANTAASPGPTPVSSPGSTASQYTSTQATSKKVKPLISAGSVNYAQMLTEANSDVPGPILAQILSGPLSGARAIGSFEVGNDLMILTFKTAVLKGKEYKIDTLALDPDTTLGGMATEVDHRYFSRVVLPAAAAFVSAFGRKLAEKPTDTVVTQGGTVITSQAKTGIEDGLYEGMGSAGQTISSFLSTEAGNTRVLVRVAVGTPLGLFFVRSVCSGEYPCQSDEEPSAPSPAVAATGSAAKTGSPATVATSGR